MSRIPLFSADNMTPEQERVYKKIVDGPRDAVVGPLRASMHRPELADRWQQFGEILRFDTSLPARLNELAILVTARRWNAQLEWEIHEKAGLAAGLTAASLDAIRDGRPPEFDQADEEEVYEFTRTLQQYGNVPEDIYQEVWQRWGTVGAVELSSVVGYYTLVAMTLNVHEIPLPDGVRPPLPTPTPTAHPARRDAPFGSSLVDLPACLSRITDNAA
jgi:4-carboxymuconolactone decarboxylase